MVKKTILATVSTALLGVTAHTVSNNYERQYVIARNYKDARGKGTDIKKHTRGFGKLLKDTKHQRYILAKPKDVKAKKLPAGLVVEELKTYAVPKLGCSRPPEMPVPEPDPDPGTQIVDWGVARVKGFEAQKIDNASSVKVCVLDTGVDFTHSDINFIYGENFTTSDPNDFADRHGHGSHTAGLVAAINNKFGVVGASQAKLLIGKVLNDFGSGYNSWIAEGIYFCADQGADIISMSLGGPEPSSVIESALLYAKSKGVITFAAAGNESSPNVGYPAAYSFVYSISALDRRDELAYFSNFGKIDFACPGVDILSTVPWNAYAVFSGTSMATPICAGIAAIFKSQGKPLSAQPLGDPQKFGQGILIGTDAFK